MSEQSSSLNSRPDKSQHKNGELSRDKHATGGGPASTGGVEPLVEGVADNGHASMHGCQNEEVGSNDHDSTSAVTSTRKSFGELSSSSSPMQRQQQDQKRQPRPLLRRVEELELNLRSIEDKYSPRSVVEGPADSPRSSCLSTPSSIEARRKPIRFVLEETEEKGTLVERVSKLEERVDTLSMQLNSPVPVLKSPPVRKDVPAALPSDLPAVEEKHEVPAIMKAGNKDNDHQPEQQQQQNHNKLNKKKHHHHRLPMLLKSCIHSSE